MRILSVGLNWKTPVSVRERLTFDSAARRHGLDRLRQEFEGSEFAILSTCNRTEIYSAHGPEGSFVAKEELVQFLSDARQVSFDELSRHLYSFEGTRAAGHLFQVAGGLDSLVLGEVQILRQVKDAYQSAIDAGSAGPVLHAIFQKALNVAKRIQTETGLAKGRLSVASAAVDYIKGVFEHFQDKTVLVIGAGKMAELTLKHLQELQPKRVLVVNRNRERAKELAEKLGGNAHPFERLRDALIEADIVISSTGADEPIIRVHPFESIMKERKQRLVAIIDIAVPRDFDVAIADLPNVLLWNIDDLEKVRHQTIRARHGELESAISIVEEEVARFEASLATLRSGPIISQLEREYQRIIDDELNWLWPQLDSLEEADRERIRHFAHRIKNKLLHPPKSAIREDAKHGHHGILDTVQRLFGLGEK